MQANMKPICMCGHDLEKIDLQYCYDTMQSIECGCCKKSVENATDIVWHCPNEKDALYHENGYDLCYDCGMDQIK